MHFGTDGIRGIVGENLTAQVAYKLGRALAIFFGIQSKILVGRDNRVSSQMLECALLSGLLEGGANAVQVGICTSPGVSFLTKKCEFNCGVMITASHNSCEYNGLKVFNFRGEKIGNCEENEIENIMQNLHLFKTVNAIKVGKCAKNSKILLKYVENIAKNANSEHFDETVVFDCANGAGTNLAKKVAKKLNLKAKFINTKINGIHINERCGATNTQDLQDAVLKEKAIVGFALDGDADRLSVVDNLGRKIDGDVILYAFAKMLSANKNLKKNIIVATVISNFGLEKTLKKIDVKVERVQVGDSKVYAKLKSDGLSFGGEKSGHLLFFNSPCSDGILSAIKLCSALNENKKFLLECSREFKSFFQIEKNIKLSENMREEILESEQFKSLVESCETTLLKNGRVLIRKSGTESLIRVLVESSKHEIGEKICDSLTKYIFDHIDIEA